MIVNENILTIAQASAVLAFFTSLCGNITAYVRGKVMEGPNKEDESMMNLFNKIFFVPTNKLIVLSDNEEKDALVNRWRRIENNNTANIPISLIVFLLAAVINSLTPTTFKIIVWIFVLARIGHTFAYACSIQPYRTIFYSISSMCMYIAAISLIFKFA